jgi:hypothetical protein
MSTRVLGGQKRSRAIVGIVALTLALVVSLLATQAISIWSSSGARLQPAPARTATNSGTYPVNRNHLPSGCRPKFGCDREGTHHAQAPRSGRWMPAGCRIKFGCPPDATSSEGH